MQNCNIYKKSQLSLAIALTLASSAPQLANAGAGWGNSTSANGDPIKTATYYANSPSGILPATDCFDTTPPSSGPFDTSVPHTPNDGTAAHITCNSGTALRKFVDTLALPGNIPNNLGNSIPVAVPDTTTYPGSDYYELAVVDYTQKMHSDLAKATTLRGYVQLSPNGTVSLNYLKGGTIYLPDGTVAKAAAKPSYMGPIISATSGRPIRVKFYNLLPAGKDGNLHVGVDETITGAGFGPDDTTKYQQNRAEIHLHGGDNPWISDGTPHQWILPAADEIALKAAKKPEMARGVSAKNVPDMPDPGPGAMTYYYPNGQSGRLMFYHDHTIGLTRLTVYSGIAAGYVINDLPNIGENHPDLKDLLPTDSIPLIIQDKTFVPKDIAMQDAKWDTTLGTEGDLWFPHVYETNQDPNSYDGTNPVGRWDWGSWFWPIFPSVYDLPTGEIKAENHVTKLGEGSTTPEAYMDTPVINGTAYPTLTVEPKAYRFRVLNASNDRFVNLGLYLAADKQTTDPEVPTNSSKTILCDGSNARPDNTLLLTSDCTEVKMVAFGSGYKPPAQAYTADGTIGFPTTGGITDTGWGAQVDGIFPQGAPDPAAAGPHIVQIGNEGGLLVNPLDIPSTILNYEYNKRSVTVLGMQEHGLFLGSAERADVLIDFSQYAGQTLILFNDAPAPAPASDPRVDYYTGNGDQTSAGGAPNTKPGYGPNTRTIMQIKVAGTASGVVKTVDIAALKAVLPKAYASSQPMPIVPEPDYNAAFSGKPGYSAPIARNNARIYTGAVYNKTFSGMSFTAPEAITYTPAPVCSTVDTCNATLASQKAKTNNGLVSAVAGTAVKTYVENKAIQELFDPVYGRMNATLGIELPFTTATTQTTIPLGYVDPATETVADGETQFWKITHNGVDSHPVHFHLVNVQVINRMGWDGTIKLPAGDEIGWKETIKMNPLEDIVVAVRAKKPTLKGITNSNTFGLPNSLRLMDPSQKEGSLIGFTQIDPTTGTPSVVANAMQNYGWEYVWHCHILGHEENDFMRPVIFNAKEAIPIAPTNLVSNGDTLSWTDNATTEYAYKVERAAIGPKQTCTTVHSKTACSTSNGPGAFADLTTSIAPAQQSIAAAPLANANTFTDKLAVVANTDYRYRVTAIGAAGNSASVTVDRIAPVAPVSPALAAATGTTTTSTTLTWTEATAIAKITSFQVWQVGNNTQIATLANTVTTYNVSGLTPATTYQFYVVAVNNNLASPHSNTVSVTTAAPITIPLSPAAPITGNLTAPSNVSIQRTSAAAATLSWTDASNNESSFQVETSTNGTTWTNVGNAISRTQAQGTTTGGALTTTVTVSNATNASYRVNAINNTTTASSASVALNDTVAPAAAGLLTVTKTPITFFRFRIGTTVNLSWTDNANNNASYTAQFSTNGGTSWSNISTTLAGNASASTQTVLVTTAASYQYRVQAVNSAGSVVSTNILSIALP